MHNPQGIHTMNTSLYHRQTHQKTLAHSNQFYCFIHRIIHFIVLVILSSAFGYLPGAHAEVVAAFGDSITHGYGAVPYTSDLQQLIDGTAQTVQVLNYGQPGERTDQGVNRISTVLGQSSPRYIIIMEGANDVIGGISPMTFRYNIGVMIDKSRGAGAAPVLGNITPDTKYNLNDAITSSYNPQISALAAEKSVALVNAYGALIGDWSHLNQDGLHPNSAGHAILAQQFYAALPYSSGGGGGGDGGGGGGGGCFIATAAFGSINEIHVLQLRRFRDVCLLTNRPGTLFVKLYYRYSPSLASFIAVHPVLRQIVRYSLYPLIGFSWLCLHTSWPVALSSTILLLLAFGMLLLKIHSILPSIPHRK